MLRAPNLPRSFYARPTIAVARDLIGKLLAHGRLAGRIVETEAYLGPDAAGRVDLAAHSARGLTPATRVIFGPPGHAYVYLIYGMYACLNLAAEADGVPGCVLIRALEPVHGVSTMRARRGLSDARQIANGPGKLTIALAVSRAHNGQDVTRGALTVRDDGVRPTEISVSPRIGIRQCADWPLRFFESGNAFVSRTR